MVGDIKSPLVGKLEKILVDVSIIQPEIDNTKGSVSTQLEKLKLGALISRIMSYDVQFHTLYELAKEQEEFISEELTSFYEGIKQRSSVALVAVENGEIVFLGELKKILESNGN